LALAFHNCSKFPNQSEQDVICTNHVRQQKKSAIFPRLPPDTMISRALSLNFFVILVPAFSAGHTDFPRMKRLLLLLGVK